MDLESLREIFKDQRIHIGIGKILRTSLLSDKSSLRAVVEMWPEKREVIATVAWSAIGPNAGMVSFPIAGDLVLLALAEGDDDLIFVIQRLSSKEDTIPANAADGATVVKSLSGKKLWLTANAAMLMLTQADAAGTENLVLGQQLKAFLIDLLAEIKDLADKVSTHTHSGNLGYPTSAPNEAGDFVTISGNVDSLSSSPVSDEAILSDFAFTEKGS